ncbi:hypothetical protein LNAOJCKE_3819 [Methylorubrum aminovorans]|uniref:DUF3102 domain-containing protein n=1 Tax=Methylorubrum aminovorans TaxID=269069 RepID=A0ABQ4UH08_9HYPH|nr:DUF3102 domain-containing protein [Methylorubrum aminovorans]GJE66599.1 hypothetical protein LNAOJCKE_3819 [Methylorubrum aminovorans]GMA76198.1 hypothetical protein GCM10025880_26150 [Methylorubrum aminovorans]
MLTQILSRSAPAYEAHSDFGHAFEAAETFNYGDLPEDVANEARAAAEQIRIQTVAAKTAFIEIGRTLLRMRDRIDHGRFLPWAHSQLGMQPRTVQRFMRAAEFVDSRPGRVSLTRLTRDGLYALTAPSVPAQVRENIVAAIDRGETMTPTEIRQRITAACPKRDARDNEDQPAPRRDREAAIAAASVPAVETESDGLERGGSPVCDAQPDRPQAENTEPLFARVAGELTPGTRHDALALLDRLDPDTFTLCLRAAVQAAVDDERCSHASRATTTPIHGATEDNPRPLPPRQLQLEL